MIGTWNVRTLSEPSRLEQVCREMDAYKLSILGLSEIRWLQSGSVLTHTGHKFLYSGSDDSRVRGVGLLLTPQASKCLVEFKPISDRIIVARFNSRFRKISIVQCYAPTEPDDDYAKDDFYSQLDATMNSLPGGDIKIIIGDFNAKVGNDNSDLQTVMGPNGLNSTRNNNGDRLVDFCARHCLFIGGTRFIHKDIYKYTWESPDGRTRNQIDHIIISKLFVGSLMDVKARRGADIDSDHNLLVGTFRLRPAAIKNNNKNIARKYNIDQLQNQETIDSYNTALRRNICDETSDGTTWQGIVHACKQSAQTVLGSAVNRRKPWISDRTWSEIQNRKQLKTRMDAARSGDEKTTAKLEYRRSATNVKNLIRLDKERYYNQIAEEAEHAANVGNMRQVYATIKKLGGNNIRSTAIIKDQNGVELTIPDEQLNRWRDFFSGNHLSSPQTFNHTLSTPLRRNQRRDISTDLPTCDEIKIALETLRNGKSSGPDDIPAELLKYGAPTLASVLTPIIQSVWQTTRMPDSWKEGVVITIPKKGDLKECKNWRGITLLNSIAKLMATLILHRIRPAVETMLRPEQAGFRPGRSCADHINTLRIIIEQSKEYNSPLYLLFVDFERAFDTVSRDALWEILSEKGIPDKIVLLIRELYRDSVCRVRFNGEESLPFSTSSGVKQGCILSPTLFLLMLESVMEKTNREAPAGIQWNLNRRLNDIDYADDICLMAHRFEDIQLKLNRLSVNAAHIGLKINIKKTKLMRLGTDNTTPLSNNGTSIDDVESFCYLGSQISINGGSDDDILARINKARVAFQAMHKIWRSNNISRNTKLRLFNSNVKSVLLYGSTTWSITQSNMKKLQTFINRCLRRILRIFWPNTISNDQLLQITNNRPVKEEIMKRKWTWIGHILRRPDGDIAKAALQWNPQGYRNPGAPRMTWTRGVKREFEALNKTWNQLRNLANDRRRWREFVIALCSI